MSDSWIDLLRFYFRDQLPVMALATVDAAGAPHVRHIICRKIEDSGNLWFISDSRSEKNQHLQHHSNSEAATWLPNLRTQFRITGTISILENGTNDLQRPQAWKMLSDASRALFLWPSPGVPFQPEKDFSRGLPATAEIPETFELLILTPNKVEHLDLTQHPHRRRRWIAADQWVEVELNP